MQGRVEGCAGQPCAGQPGATLGRMGSLGTLSQGSVRTPVSAELVGGHLVFGMLDAVASMVVLGEGSLAKWVATRRAACGEEVELLDEDASSGCEDVPLGVGS